MVNSLRQVLRLISLAEGMPGVSPEVGMSWAQACAVCLHSNDHSDGVELHVSGIKDAIFAIEWDPDLTDQVLRTWGDEATEHGACAITYLLIPRLPDYTIIRRARNGEGVDYWLGDLRSDNILKNAARLEISGILKGNKSSIKSRVKTKKKQTERSEGELPAYVAVVEFSKPEAQVVRK